jgi:pimeloyl-ACP methyl ester carboxylesterase
MNTAELTLPAHRPAREVRPWWGVALLPLSALLLGVAAGVGYPYLTRVGWSALSVAGAGALLLGVVTLAAGLWWLGTSTARWLSVLLVPMALLSVVLLAYVVAIPLAATVVPHPPAGGRTPDAVGLPYTRVSLPTADGETLAGWQVESANGAAVVLLPGSGSSKAATLEHAAVLAEAGYGVLMVDPRGHGDSSGRGMDWGWHGDSDIAAAIDALTTAPDVDQRRIAVVGLSVGGEEAVGAAAGDPRIAAVVAEGVTGRSGQDLDWLSEEYGWRGAVTEGVKDVQTALVSLLAGVPPPVALTNAAAAASRPTLLVVAGGVPDEQHAAERIRAAAPETVEVWVVPGSGHTAGLRTEPEDWEQTVVAFLDRALQAP